MADVNDLISQLNGYTGDNVWQDLIMHSDLYDEAATVVADPGGASDVVILASGTVIRYDAQQGEWGVEV